MTQRPLLEKNKMTSRTLTPIFIGGADRLGPELLHSLLGCHHQIYALPGETRFIIEPDGLVNLVDALTTRYSPNLSREALYKFIRLMRGWLADSGDLVYPDHSLTTWIDARTYQAKLAAYYENLLSFGYEGVTLPLRLPLDKDEEGAWNKQVQTFAKQRRGLFKDAAPRYPRRQVSMANYFADRSELVRLTAEFVDALFMSAVVAQHKQTWCEKTPGNLMMLDFLWELFPQATFVHVISDPRSVLVSMRESTWAPDDVPSLCLWLKHTYERWFDLKARLDVSRYRYLEVQLDHLVAYPAATLEKISGFCGLSNEHSELPQMALAQLPQWQNSLKFEEMQLVNKILGPYIVQMGYTI